MGEYRYGILLESCVNKRHLERGNVDTLMARLDGCRTNSK
jgi:hypothetical protein